MQKMIRGGLRARAALSVVSMAAALAFAIASAPAGASGLSAGSKSAKTLPQVKDPRVVDEGAAAATQVQQALIWLPPPNPAALEAAVAAAGDSTSPSFRKFMTPAQFGATYGQSDAVVANVVQILQAGGLTVDKVYSDHLLIVVEGTAQQLDRTLGTNLHTYALGSTTWTASATKPVLPAALVGKVAGVSGLSTRSILKSHAVAVPHAGPLAGDVVSSRQSGLAYASGTPGQYLIGDLAAKYNIDGLWARGVTGAGKTIGIATLAGYNQSDAYDYWEGVGLNVKPNRITDVVIGAGPSEGPGTGGAGETTLDVQQSGGVAPGADMRVYLAPNTDVGFVQVFAEPIEDNIVDVLSISWGSAEIANDPDTMTGLHYLFDQAALQGIPVIAAAGDAGAYDINRDYTYPQCTTLLDVDYPAADPVVLAAGGTTLPNTVQHLHGPVTVSTERAWGWDYLKDYIVKFYGTDLYYNEYFAVGGGGGVSVNFTKPAHQNGLAGVQTSASAQSLFCQASFVGQTGSGYVDLIDMPAGVAGRNLPDVSLNADPYSGYLTYQDGKAGSGEGGTSYVAPQLNGILTLISSGVNGRLGPINPQLYALFKAKGYSAGSPFRPITAGDNEYYKSTSTYNPATGLGSLDVNALATALGVH